MPGASANSAGSSTWVDHIPVLWFEPPARPAVRLLVLFLPHLSGSKESMTPFLQDLAAAGFVALSFDPWQHGERGTESQDELLVRVFGNFRRHMWPILGQTTLDTMRVIDWALANLDIHPAISVGGLSMGGDIAVAAAGIDHRIQRVVAVVATPDWLRPGMHDLFEPDRLLPPGEPDAYARYFYDHLNPMTHLAAYAHGPALRFICGERDVHVPADGALRFQAALREAHPSSAAEVLVELVPGMDHLAVRDPALWWPRCLAALAG